MRHFIFILTVCLFINKTYAQFSIGPKVSLGAGMINSKNLRNNINAYKLSDPKIQRWEINNKFGFCYSIGAFAQYGFNEQFAILTEPSFGGLKSTILMDYIKNNVDGSGNGEIKTVNSEAAIKLSYFALPLLAKYSFSKGKGFFVVSGIQFDFTGKPRIQSIETKTTVKYINNGIDKTDVSPDGVNSVLNVFKSPRASFIIGVGLTTDVANRSLSVDLRYHLPVTKSEMYTTDSYYDNHTFNNNEYFDIWGKSGAEKDFPAYLLNDFKMSVIGISISYSLFKK